MSDEEDVQLWLMISKFQFWSILITVVVSLVVVSKATWDLMKQRKSHFFHFLLSILIANYATLIIILFDIMNFSSKGALLCKLELFISNSAACFINWIWLCLFAQRFLLLNFPLKFLSNSRAGCVRSPKTLIAATAMFALLTQSWSLIFITELTMTADGQVMSVCERDESRLSSDGYKLIALADAFITYVFPFVVTIVADVSVLILSTRNTFVVLSSEALHTPSKATCETNALLVVESARIQSEKSIQDSRRRHQKAVRRCQVMATIQVLLNAPYYSLQLVDEAYSLRKYYMSIYLYLDAFLYFIYLMQFPMVYVYIKSLTTSRSKTRGNESRATNSRDTSFRTDVKLSRTGPTNF